MTELEKRVEQLEREVAALTKQIADMPHNGNPITQVAYRTPLLRRRTGDDPVNRKKDNKTASPMADLVMMSFFNTGQF